MSDWEDLCEWMGVPNDEFAVDRIVDYINESNERENQKYLASDSNAGLGSNKFWFSTFQEALAWARANPGKAIIPAPDGKGYVNK